MLITILVSMVLAFCVTLVFGKGFIPWLKDHGMTQPIKDEVAEKIYAEQATESAHTLSCND